MKFMYCVLTGVLVFACSSVALGQAKPAESRSVSQIMDRAVGQVEGEFLPAADAMPENKYSFAPTSGEFKGVRTFAGGFRHVRSVR